MILGDGIRLRAIEESDIPRFVEWLNDPEVYKNLRLIYPLGTAMEQAWFARLKDRDPSHPPAGDRNPATGRLDLHRQCRLQQHRLDQPQRRVGHLHRRKAILEPGLWQKGHAPDCPVRF